MRRYPAELYRLYSTEGQLLYVGVSGNIRERLRCHACRPPVGKAWWGSVAWCSLEAFPKGYLALAAEVAAIKTERPLHNKRSAVV